jgi:hypothetical protein
MQQLCYSQFKDRCFGLIDCCHKKNIDNISRIVKIEIRAARNTSYINDNVSLTEDDFLQQGSAIKFLNIIKYTL